MDLSRDLSTWTFSAVHAIVDSAEYEPGNFDFKEAVTGRDPDLGESIRRTACAMANTDGGFLIFGVKDRGRCKAGEDRIVGIELRPETDLAKQFGDHVQHIGPPIRFDRTLQPIRLPSDQIRGLFVVRIDRSPTGPHEYGGIFYKRGDGGACQHMDAHEVRNHMLLSEERLRKVALLRLDLKDIVLTCRAMGDGVDRNANLSFDRFDAGSFKALISDTCATLPAGLKLQEDLLTIARLARRVNEILLRLNEHYLKNWSGDRFPGFAEAARDASKRLTDLYSAAEKDRQKVEGLCKTCEETLSAHFGPLLGA